MALIRRTNGDKGKVNCQKVRRKALKSKKRARRSVQANGAESLGRIQSQIIGNEETTLPNLPVLLPVKQSIAFDFRRLQQRHEANRP